MPRKWRVICLLFVWVASISCHRGLHHEEEDEPSNSRGRRIRVLDSSGSLHSSFRLKSRSVSVYDERGILIVRARHRADYLEVIDRRAETVLILEPRSVDSATEPDGPPFSATLRAGDRTPLGELNVWPGSRVQRTSVRGAEIGQVVVHASQEGEVAEVYGADGTDLVMRVYSDGPHSVAVVDGDGDLIATLDGAPLPAWIIGSAGLESPLEGDFAAFQAVVILYLKRLEFEPLPTTPEVGEADDVETVETEIHEADDVEQ